MTLSTDTQRKIRSSRICVCLVTTAWLTDERAQATYASARDQGLPIRVIVAPGVHLPEDAFLGVADLEIVHSRGAVADAEQIRAWVIDGTRGVGR
jgi:hypothetical protein